MVLTMHFVREYAPMAVYSLSFLYVFLPLAVLVFALGRPPVRAKLLLGISVGFYALAQPRWLLPFLAAVAVDYGAIRLMERWEGRPRLRLACGAVSVGKTVALVFAGMAGVQTGAVPVLPLGLLVYGLSSAGVVADCCRKNLGRCPGFVEFALYVLFFPRLYAGPFWTWAEFSPQPAELHFDGRQLVEGGGCFARGAFAYLVFGRTLYGLFEDLKGWEPAEATTLSTWCMVLFLALSLYYILEGFSAMARGLGQVFGLRLPQNYYYPYQSRSITDFFQRFNITLHALLWKGVHSGPERNEESALTGILKIVAVGMLAGIWFGLRVNYLAWGLYLALFLILERYVYGEFLSRIPVFFRRIYTLGIVLVGFTILAGDTLAQSGALLSGMFGLAGAAADNQHLFYLLSSNWLLLVLAGFFATNAASLAVRALRRTAPQPAFIAMGVLDAGVFIVLTAWAL